MSEEFKRNAFEFSPLQKTLFKPFLAVEILRMLIELAWKLIRNGIVKVVDDYIE